MNRSVKAAVYAGAVIVGALYIGCVVWDLGIPRFAMRSAWMPFLPGFTWLTWGSFLLGLAESLAYGALLGWLIAWVPATVARAVR